MEMVALNEQLREEFSAVIKNFLTIRRKEIAHVATLQATAVGGVLRAAAASLVPDGKQPTTPTPQQQPVIPCSDGPTQAEAEPNAEPTPLPQPQLPSPATQDQEQQQSQSASNKEPLPTTPDMPTDEQLQQYAQHAQLILRRVNMYQYKSREQFAQDILKLQALAMHKDQQLMLTHLANQQHELAAAEAEKSESARRKRRKVNGIRVDSTAIPGIQEQRNETWVCSFNLAGHPSTFAKFGSREKCLNEYNCIRDGLQKSPDGFHGLQKEARPLASVRTEFDKQIFKGAMSQVKQKLPIQKHHDVSSLLASVATPQSQSQSSLSQQAPPPSSQTQTFSTTTTTAIVAAKNKDKEPKATRKRELVVDTAAAAAASSTSAPSSGNSKTAITPAAATPELVAHRTPTDHESRVSFLRLRRLMQMRLCRHLEGREICTRLNDPDAEEDESWEPTGRLEKGRVFSYASQKHESFSDFVIFHTKKSVAACGHLFVIETQENIDAHLLVCDQFDDNVRMQLGRNFKEVTEKYMAGKL